VGGPSLGIVDIVVFLMITGNECFLFFSHVNKIVQQLGYLDISNDPQFWHML